MPEAEEEPFGLLLLDKPVGLTSHSAVRRAARLLGVQKAGHAGTLDPLASGLLLVGLGRATRLLEYLVGHDKAYRARVRLGEVRDTLDREGQVLETHPVEGVTPPRVQAALAGLRGTVLQVPPLHCAIKMNGQPLYRRVRRGEAVSPPPREVEITRLELALWESPDLVLDISCSSGTYVRSVARDLGQALGTGAVLWELARTRSGPFRLEEAVTLEALEAAGAGRWGLVLPAERMVHGLPRLALSESEARALTSGRALPRAGGSVAGDVAVFDEAGLLLAVARFEGEELKPVKVLRPFG